MVVGPKNLSDNLNRIVNLIFLSMLIVIADTKEITKNANFLCNYYKIWILSVVLSFM
jgi:hypothetical protein